MPLASHVLVFRFHTRVAATLAVALIVATAFVASLLSVAS